MGQHRSRGSTPKTWLAAGVPRTSSRRTANVRSRITSLDVPSSASCGVIRWEEKWRRGSGSNPSSITRGRTPPADCRLPVQQARPRTGPMRTKTRGRPSRGSAARTAGSRCPGRKTERQRAERGRSYLFSINVLNGVILLPDCSDLLSNFRMDDSNISVDLSQENKK